MKKAKFSFFSIIAIIIILAAYTYHTFNTKKYNNPSGGNNSVIAWDVISYYAYLPATFIEKDYKFRFMDSTTNDYSRKYWPEKISNGNRVIKTSMGLSIMYSPFFFIAHSLSNSLGYEADGFTTPYAFALIFSSIIYTILGLILLRKILLKYFNDLIVTFTLLIICLATNLYWYVVVEGPVSHSYSFALFSTFMYLNEKWHEKQSWKNSILLGLVLGLISLVRPTNCIIIIIFLLYNVYSKSSFIDKITLFIKNYKKILIFALFTFIVWIPQLLYWKSVTGSWLYYSYGEYENFYFTNPKIFEVLFSFRKGWLIYTPVMIFSIIGIGMLWKMNKKYFFPILIFLIINIYIISSWWSWWYGGGFGMRPMIESYALLAIPLACFFKWISQKKSYVKVPTIAIVTLFTFYTAFNTIQYYYGAIHWASMTKEAYIDSFGRITPSENFYNLLQDPPSKVEVFQENLNK